jgi:hypothetical protein
VPLVTCISLGLLRWCSFELTGLLDNRSARIWPCSQKGQTRLARIVGRRGRWKASYVCSKKRKKKGIIRGKQEKYVHAYPNVHPANHVSLYDPKMCIQLITFALYGMGKLGRPSHPITPCPQPNKLGVVACSQPALLGLISCELG